MKLLQPKYKGGTMFWDNVPAKDASFAWGDLCVTGLNKGASLAPDPEMPKMWYNTYVYVPEERGLLEAKYLDRFVPDPEHEGEWLDVVKAQRMVGYFDKHRQEHEQQEAEREAVEKGEDVFKTPYVDVYSGDHLQVHGHELYTWDELRKKYGIYRSEWKDIKEKAGSGWDWDNLRVPWVFDRPQRNKQVSQNAYDWFDRKNKYIPTDRSYEMQEMPSVYVDKENYNKWRTGGGGGALDMAEDVVTRARAFDDHPYQM